MTDLNAGQNKLMTFSEYQATQGLSPKTGAAQGIAVQNSNVPAQNNVPKSVPAEKQAQSEDKRDTLIIGGKEITKKKVIGLAAIVVAAVTAIGTAFVAIKRGKLANKGKEANLIDNLMEGLKTIFTKEGRAKYKKLSKNPQNTGGAEPSGKKPKNTEKKDGKKPAAKPDKKRTEGKKPAKKAQKKKTKKPASGPDNAQSPQPDAKKPEAKKPEGGPVLEGSPEGTAGGALNGDEEKTGNRTYADFMDMFHDFSTGEGFRSATAETPDLSGLEGVDPETVNKFLSMFGSLLSTDDIQKLAAEGIGKADTVLTPEQMAKLNNGEAQKLISALLGGMS